MITPEAVKLIDKIFVNYNLIYIDYTLAITLTDKAMGHRLATQRAHLEGLCVKL